jgi:hypothetical protein
MKGQAEVILIVDHTNMTRITATKLGRAKYRDAKAWGYELVNGKPVKKRVIVKRISGYNPPEPRSVMTHPTRPELSVLASPGQRINFGRAAYKQGLTRLKR